MDEVLEQQSGFWPSARKDWWAGGFVFSSRCSEGRAGANIPLVAKSPVCGGPASTGGSGEKLQDFSKMPLHYNEFFF